MHSEDSDHTANVQADLNLHPAHMFKGIFSDVETKILSLPVFFL